MKRLLFLLLFFSNISLGHAQAKLEKIYRLLEISDYQTFGKAMIDGYVDNYKNQLDDNPQIQDSIKSWLATGYGALMDSIAIIYDQQFSEKDIDEMLVYYDSRVGQKVRKLTPLITELSMRAGKNWGIQNEAALIERLTPALEQEQQKYTYEALYNPEEEFQQLNYSFVKPSGSVDTFQSTQFDYLLHYDPEQWVTIDCAAINPDAEVCFQTKDQQAYSIVIVEPIQADLHQLKAVALANLYAATKAVDFGETGLIEVNQKQLLKMELEAKVRNYDISYYNYYLSTDWGIIQLLTFCGKSVKPQYFDTMKDFNNGIVVK